MSLQKDQMKNLEYCIKIVTIGKTGGKTKFETKVESGQTSKIGFSIRGMI